MRQEQNNYTVTNRRFEKKWFPKVKKAIESKISSLIEKIKQDGLQAGVRYLEMDLPNGKLAEVVSSLYEEVGMYYARQSDRRLQKVVRDSKSYYGIEVKRLGSGPKWLSYIRNFLKMFLIEKITFKVNETTRDYLLKVMQKAINEGWGVDQTVRHLGELPLAEYQSARIVRTEINRASNTGIQAQGETFEYELQKEWISVKDNRSRGAHPEDHTDHLHMDGQTVDFEEKFKDGRSGHVLRFPGDPEAKAEDTINCRCYMGTKPKRDENGRLIPKIKQTPLMAA